MKFTILTLFPNSFSYLQESIIKRATDKKLVEIEFVDFRQFSKNKHKSVDDKLYGGGRGMLLTCQPIYDAIQTIDPDRKATRIFFCAKGKKFDQDKAKVIAYGKQQHYILLCGHYEGVDERVLELCFDERISIGDYVLTGGELPASVFVDCVVRLLDGTLSKDAVQNESHFDGFLEEPQYTRPQNFKGLEVPKVLVDGNHQEIAKWRQENKTPL